MYNKIQNLFQNEIKRTKWKINLLQDRLEQFKKRRSLLQNRLEEIAKLRKIKNYQKMSKEWLIIALLKSKGSFAELFNNNFDNHRIRGIKKSLNKLRDRLSKEYRKEI